MNPLNFMYFLDAFVVVIRGSAKGRNGFINHIHGSGLSLYHGSEGKML